MFTVVRSEYIRHSLENAISRWWERHELPPVSLLRDGLLLLEQGGDLTEGQRAILLRAALGHGKGVRTALRHQTNPERTAILLNDSLLMVNSQWAENDLRQWMQTDPNVRQWCELLRTELLATNQVALPGQRRKIATLLATMDEFDENELATVPVAQHDDWDIFAEAALAASEHSVRPSKVRFMMATALLLLLAIFFYQYYAPILGQSDMVEVTALLPPPPELLLVTPTSEPSPTVTETATEPFVPPGGENTPVNPSHPEASFQPTSPLQADEAEQPVSPLQPAIASQFESPLQPVSPLQNESPLPLPTETVLSTPTHTTTPWAVAATSTPIPTLAPVLTIKFPSEPDPVVRTVFIDRTEVTNVAYRACVAVGKCPEPSSNESATRKEYYRSPVYDDYPVVNVDLMAAYAYCAYLGARLPSVEEWEAAASYAPATDRHYRYPWGNQFVAQYVNSAESKHQDTTMAGAFRPNGNSPWGLDDMAGNVAEWTATLVTENGNYKALVKGGSFQDSADNLLSDAFQLVNIEDAEPWIGFRCAR